MRIFQFVLGMGLLVGCQSQPVEALEPVGFKPIFNGQDLSGWSGEEKFWKVVDGVITAESTEQNPCDHNTFLRWAAGDVDDFELKLEFRISGSDSANSGVQFRSQVEPDGHVVGYQADIDLAGNWLGACYDEKGRGLLAGRGHSSTVSGPKEIQRDQVGNAEELFQHVNKGGWNEYHITARGNELTLAVNGHQTAHVVDNDPENRDFSGVLALQLHSGPPMKIEFRNIQLKRLPLQDRKKVVFVAGSKSHGYFSHEHNAGCLLLADMLQKSSEPVQTAVYLNGWPKDVTAFDNADTVVCYCDGGGNHFLNPHLAEFDRVMSRGTGLVCLHYAVETVIGSEGEHFLKWLGGYFEPNWSVNPHWTAEFKTFPDHPVTRGVKPFDINDEWYYHMRFRPDMQGVTPILTAMPPRETLNRQDGPHSGNPHVRESVLVRKEPQHVAWVAERENDGRAFGFTGGHFHKNWQHDEFRKLVLNAICWTAHVDIPSTGVTSQTPSQEQMEANQDYPKPENWKFEPVNQAVKTSATEPKKSSGKPVKPLFASKTVNAGTPNHSVNIDVPIAGAKSLYLVVADGGNGFSCDWADWVEPVLVSSTGETKLTDLNWVRADSQWGSVQKNKNCGGQQMRVNGSPVEFGIGTHANSFIEFKLPEGHQFERFKAIGGLDNGGTDQGGNQTSVEFLVFDQQPAQSQLVRTDANAASRDLSEALNQLEVAPGLQLELFSGEPMMFNPTNMEIDHRGRIWICEVINYRQFRNQDSAERTEGDRILILEDTDLDGKADKSTTFYQGRDIDSAHGICLLGNKAIVSAGDSVFILTDENGDDRADKKEVLFTGISGVQHDHGIHACVFGPDGKLYFNFGNEGRQIKDKNGQPIIDKAGNEVNNSRHPYQEGMVFRCNLDGSEFETLGWNFRNNWEVCVDSFGTMWQSDNDDDGNRGVRINYVMEYGNYGYKDELTGAGWRDPRTGWSEEIPLRHWHQNDPGTMPNLLQTGGGSPTGILVYEGSLLPALYQNQLIHCDAGPNVVRAYPAETAGAGYTATMENVVDGLGRDSWFRPSDVCIAPDGSLFIADWYDPGVGGHRMGDVERGRVFRVSPEGSRYSVPAIDVSTISGAIAALCSPNLAARYLGWTTLVSGGEAAEAELRKLLTHENPRYQARALWVLGKMPLAHGKKVDLLRTALMDDQPDIRITALRLSRQLSAEVNPHEILDVLDVNDPSAAVRREMLIALREIEVPDAATHWAVLAQQHDGHDRWYLEALGIAADHHWDEYLPTLLAMSGNITQSKALRDIVWRSRAKQTPELLARLISSPDVPAEELPRYFRSLDFCPEVPQELLAGLAFKTDLNNPRADLIISESVSRLQGVDLKAHPEYRTALTRLLDQNQDSQTFLSIVDRFQIEDRYPDLVSIASRFAGDQLGVDATRILLKHKQWILLISGMKDQKPVAGAALADVLGLSGENAAVGPLKTIMADKTVDLGVQRAAVSALGKTRQGTLHVMQQAQEGNVPQNLSQVAAAVLHASIYKDVKDVADKLYPLPPSKGDTPLPPISALVEMKGDAKNGRIVYHTHGTCAKCHIENGQGKEVGPELSEIGKKLAKQALFESILYPSAGISHNYETYTVVTTDGTIVTGLLVSQTDQEVSVKDSVGIVKTVEAKEIDEMAKQQISLMPADLVKLMSEKDLVDLVEYLTTLKEKKK